MSDKDAACYRVAEIAAKAAADQLRLRAARGQAKSPANAAAVVAGAWEAALKRARASDQTKEKPTKGGGSGAHEMGGIPAHARAGADAGLIVEPGTGDGARALAALLADCSVDQGLAAGECVVVGEPWGALDSQSANESMHQQLEAIAEKMASWARSAMGSAARQDPADDFGRRFIEHGGMCYFNCWSLLRAFLDASCPPPSDTQEEG